MFQHFGLKLPISSAGATCRRAEVNKKKKGRKEERHPKQWQTGYSPRPPTSSDQNQTFHGGWPAVCNYTCQVWSKSVKGLRRCGVENGPSHYFGQWLIQQLVLPYKPWKQHTFYLHMHKPML